MADYLLELKSELWLRHKECGTFPKSHMSRRRIDEPGFMDHAMECPAPECARVAGLIRREEAKDGSTE